VDNRPLPLYTKTGDAGETGLFDGTRVPKHDPMIEATGALDELGAWLGVAATHLPTGELHDITSQLQRDVFALGAMVADPGRRIAARVEKAFLKADDVERLERWIDALQAEVPPLRRFVLAGGSASGAYLHLARTVCRRAERRLVALMPTGAAMDPVVLVFVNRLSDLLFVMARAANVRAGIPEIEW
jgi:cob(I)alamin adenosyltransferase